MATEDADVDPEQLRAQLGRIQEAMGIQERYESGLEQWLFYGVVVALASVASQYAYANELAGYWYWAIWFGGFAGASVLYTRVRGGRLRWGRQEGRPDVGLLFGAVYFAFLPIVSLAERFAGSLTYAEQSQLGLSVIVVLLGVAYLVVGNVLKAYYIRARDRYAFYGGGVLLVALGSVLPSLSVGREYPYLVFGGVYLVYAVGVYAYLR